MGEADARAYLVTCGGWSVCLLLSRKWQEKGFRAVPKKKAAFQKSVDADQKRKVDTMLPTFCCSKHRQNLFRCAPWPGWKPRDTESNQIGLKVCNKACREKLESLDYVSAQCIQTAGKTLGLLCACSGRDTWTTIHLFRLP